ncbi:MAG: ABC transporter substrate-binding protein [Betaproteobacteria bacterium]|nr:ABC transporter substrate-binding protein [Betaproteobacteria bacterium]
MSLLNLSIATTDYDHFRDIRMGFVKPEGIDLNWLNLGHHECFARFTANREFDISELSFAKFTTQVTRPDSDIIGLPIVCSRLFRFSSFYVNKKSGIKSVKDLIGKKVGSPEWAHSAAVYMRGWLHNDMGVKLQDVKWYQAGANAPGREEKVEITLPEGVTHPWVPRNLFNAFLESKRRSIERLMDPAVSRYPLPWLATYARKMRDKFEGDTFPYGIEENRPTWELMAKYTFQQGIAHREFTPEEIFPQGMMTKVVI